MPLDYCEKLWFIETAVMITDTEMKANKVLHTHTRDVRERLHQIKN